MRFTVAAKSGADAVLPFWGGEQPRRLPPEQLRQGRFGQVLFMDVPRAADRQSIFAVHLARIKRDPAAYDLPLLAQATEGFAGAEIEGVVKAALTDAFRDGARELSTADMLARAETMTPISVLKREEVELLRAWAREHGALDVAALGTSRDVAHAAPCPPRTAVLRVARLYHGSVADGPGRRSALAVQGCPLRCPGCYVPETHDPRGGVAPPVTQVRDLLLAPDGTPRDGISVVGGEPFAQPEALHALLQLCRPQVPHITVYSGCTLAALLRRTEPAVRGILGMIDLLVDGPGRMSRRWLAGPANGVAPANSACAGDASCRAPWAEADTAGAVRPTSYSQT